MNFLPFRRIKKYENIQRGFKEGTISTPFLSVRDVYQFIGFKSQPMFVKCTLHMAANQTKMLKLRKPVPANQGKATKIKNRKRHMAHPHANLQNILQLYAFRAKLQTKIRFFRFFRPMRGSGFFLFQFVRLRIFNFCRKFFCIFAPRPNLHRFKYYCIIYSGFGDGRCRRDEKHHVLHKHIPKH